MALKQTAGSTATSPPTMSHLVVGGPILGYRSTNNDNNSILEVSSKRHFEPLISPPAITSTNHGNRNYNRGEERYVFLPTERFITVLAYATGKKVATIVPVMDEQDKYPVYIECVSLAVYPKKQQQQKSQTYSVQSMIETMKANSSIGNNNGDSDDDDDDVMAQQQQQHNECVLLIGCRDGTIREFYWNELHASKNQPKKTLFDCSPYYVTGPCFQPQRRILVTNKNEPIIHIASPAESASTAPVYDNGDLPVVIISRNNIQNMKKSSVRTSVYWIQLPKINGKNNNVNVDLKRDVGCMKIIDTIECQNVRQKQGHSRLFDNLPFRLSVVLKAPNSSKQRTDNNQSIFVVVARAFSVHVYFTQLCHFANKSMRNVPFQSTGYQMPNSNPLVSFCISPNNNDVARGHQIGDIWVMKNFFNVIEDYHLAMEKYQLLVAEKSKVVPKRPLHPSEVAVARKLHWHSRPVTTLAYDAIGLDGDPILYSGAEECVLITWQLSKGLDKPADVLPRIALGGIVHVVCPQTVEYGSTNGILVFCEDNTLQSFESHSKGRLWKFQGLASMTLPGSNFDQVSMQVDPRSKNNNNNYQRNSDLVLVGLPGAPGQIQWYDSVQQIVTSTLEVVPFNRVSQAEFRECPLPSPKIINHAFSANGQDLITIDEIVTENAYVGALQVGQSGAQLGTVINIRFWTLNRNVKEQNHGGGFNTAPYKLQAVMTYPHGPRNRISALAITIDGQYACTASDDEKAFRIWCKAQTMGGTDKKPGAIAAWSCQYKISTPSGFSNHCTLRDAIAFSSDGSILAICFGNMISLWDAHETILLTWLEHLEGGEGAPIESVEFVSTDDMDDMILSKSSAGVMLQSPFGNNHQSTTFQGWSWQAPSDNSLYISNAEMVANEGFVAVTISDANESTIVLLDASTGKPLTAEPKDNNEILSLKVQGQILSIAKNAQPRKVSAWNERKNKNEQSLSLKNNNAEFYILANDGNLYAVHKGSLSTDSTTNLSSLTQTLTNNNVNNAVVPRLDIPTKTTSNNSTTTKRRRTGEVRFAAEIETKRLALEVFGLANEEGGRIARPPTFELPSLSGAFVRSFVARNLGGSNNDATSTRD